MEQARLLIAIVLSVLVFLAWQFFFVDKKADQKSAQKVEQPAATAQPTTESQPYLKPQEGVQPDKAVVADTQAATPARIPQSITVDTPYYRVKLSEKGAAFTSFVLKKYRENVQKNSALKELLPQTDSNETVLLGFAGKSLPGFDTAVFSTNANAETINITDAAQEITFSWKSDTGVVVEKTYKFSPDSYLIGLRVTIKNGSDRTLQDKLSVALNSAVPNDKQSYGFEGPSALIDKKLEEIKIKNIADQSTYAGNIKWIALQDR